MLCSKVSSSAEDHKTGRDWAGPQPVSFIGRSSRTCPAAADRADIHSSHLKKIVMAPMHAFMRKRVAASTGTVDGRGNLGRIVENTCVHCQT